MIHFVCRVKAGKMILKCRDQHLEYAISVPQFAFCGFKHRTRMTVTLAHADSAVSGDVALSWNKTSVENRHQGSKGFHERVHIRHGRNNQLDAPAIRDAMPCLLACP